MREQKTIVRIHRCGSQRPGLLIPAARGGVAIPDHNKIHNIGNPVCDGQYDLIVCILKLNNWGNFTILWSLQRRRVVFKFAFWEKAAECHLLGRCTLMRCQRNGK